VFGACSACPFFSIWGPGQSDEADLVRTHLSVKKTWALACHFFSNASGTGRFPQSWLALFRPIGNVAILLASRSDRYERGSERIVARPKGTHASPNKERERERERERALEKGPLLKSTRQGVWGVFSLPIFFNLRSRAVRWGRPCKDSFECQKDQGFGLPLFFKRLWHWALSTVLACVIPANWECGHFARLPVWQIRERVREDSCPPQRNARQSKQREREREREHWKKDLF